MNFYKINNFLKFLENLEDANELRSSFPSLMVIESKPLVRTIFSSGKAMLLLLASHGSLINSINVYIRPIRVPKVLQFFLWKKDQYIPIVTVVYYEEVHSEHSLIFPRSPAPVFRLGPFLQSAAEFNLFLIQFFIFRCRQIKV